MKYYHEDGALFGMDDEGDRHLIPEMEGIEYHHAFEDVPDPRFGEDGFEAYMAKLHNSGLFALENFYRNILNRPAEDTDPEYTAALQEYVESVYGYESPRTSKDETQQIIAEIFNCPLDLVDDFVRVSTTHNSRRN